MIDMNTDEILNALKDENKKEFPKEYFGDEKVDVVEYLETLLREHDTTIRDLIPGLGYERSYTYQMFNGTRVPTRVFLLRLAILLKLDYEETQRTLFVTGNTLLYAKIQFDAVMIYALERHFDVSQLEDLLQEVGEKSLFWK
ncbi:MAG: hypothetical protein VZQ83_05205 [Eubacterium sp.]|nr:hypothetical protein [Eubacterium sp.]